MSTTFYRHEVSYLYYFGQSTLSNQREFRSVGLLLIAGSGVASWSPWGGGGEFSEFIQPQTTAFQTVC